MNDFTASNGIRVRITRDGELRMESPEFGNVTLGEYRIGALREFFRAEEDERLGRWRWPDNPAIVIYRYSETYVRVVREDDGTGEDFYRSGVEANRGRSFPSDNLRAAMWYFDAHPEPKPWHDAKPGETWRLTVNDRSPLEMDLTFNVIGVEGVIPSRFARPQVGGEQMEYPLDSPAITAGRRIWPEVSS